ncbi:hypothetical protein QCA50_006909 [Cerrena zonata]|uniref:F-box domain-containing protein n=1 Tax=Cerrena zonata TaxID=2478898 RepID=A0AAW0GET9_9APHY
MVRRRGERIEDLPQESPPLPPPLSRRPDTSRSLLSAPRLHESQPHSPAAHSPRAESLRSADPLAEPTSVGIGIRAINSSSSATLSQALGPHPLTAPSNPGLAPSIEQGRHLASSSLNFYHPFVQFRSAHQTHSDKFGRPYKHFPKSPMAAIHSLPVELVARIFSIGTQDQGEPDAIEVGAHRFEVLVSHVCQYWRHTCSQYTELMDHHLLPYRPSYEPGVRIPHPKQRASP